MNTLRLHQIRSLMLSRTIFTFALGSLLLCAGSSHAKTKRVVVSLEKISSGVRSRLESPQAFTAETCATTLQEVTKSATSFSSANVHRADLARSTSVIVDNFWHARLALRDRFSVIAHAGQMHAACVSAAREAFRSFRFLEEYAGVHALAKRAWISPTPSRVYGGGLPSTMMRPGLSQLQFRSGDVLVSYGMAYGSAAIAHVGDDPGSFSHMALVYVNPQGAAFTIEAHPEFGVKVAPIEKYMNDGKGRSALFRHEDAELAALAAKRMYDIAYAADSSGHPIPYDFTMDLSDHSKLFCTEVVYYAFQMASGELHRPFVMPAYPTKISMKNSYILDAFGIKTRTAFAPSDIEVDAQFQQLAEWRDLPRVRLMHHQQAALQSEFRWLDSLAYSYRSNLQTVFESRALFAARHLPLFEGFVDDLVPPDLSDKTLEAVVQVYLTSDYIHNDLILRDKVAEDTNGTLMTQKEINEAVEDGRLDDLEAYLDYQRWLQYDRYSGDSAPPSDQWHVLMRADDEKIQ